MNSLFFSNLLSHALIAHVAHNLPTVPTLDKVMLQWEADWTVLLPMAISIAVYAAGWWQLRKRRVDRFSPAKLYLFLASMASLYIALQSPIDALGDSYLLCMHMVQHLFLWFIVPLLFWISEPFAPFVFGLPDFLRRKIISPMMRSKKVRAFFARLTHPVVAWPVFVVNMWIWHVPYIYDLALHYQWFHNAEHLTFLLTGVIFWWPVIRPYPARIKWTPWLLLPYLMLAGVQGTVLSAIIVFAEHVIYPFYLHVPRITHLTPLADQQVAGAIMWVPGSIVYVAALLWVTRGLFSGRGGLGDQETLALQKRNRARKSQQSQKTNQAKPAHVLG